MEADDLAILTAIVAELREDHARALPYNRLAQPARGVSGSFPIGIRYCGEPLE